MKKLYTSIFLSAAVSFAAIADQASYENPTGLRYIGTIGDQRTEPVCSYLSRNPMNENAFLWTPAGSKVMYSLPVHPEPGTGVVKAVHSKTRPHRMPM